MSNKKDKIALQLSGMTCTGCAANIEKRLKETKGVDKVSVNFTSEKAFITYNSGKISIDGIIAVIKELGYNAKVETNREDDIANIKIEGMSCVSCAHGLEKSIGSLDGVKSISINYGSEILMLHYDKSILSLETVIKKVEESGYQAVLQEDTETSDESGSYLETAKKRMIYSSIFSGLIMGIMIIQMITNVMPPILYRFVAAVLAFPVVFIFGLQVHKSSLASIRNKSANMDVLVSLGSLPPYIIGLAGFFFEMQTFVEMAASIITFHLIGKYLETRAKGKASDAIKKLINLGAKTALIDNNGEAIEVPIEHLKVGDIMIIKPGEKIPTDGIIIEGATSIDESMVSGESMPVHKKNGDEVIGATVNQLGFIKARVTKIGRETFLSQVIKLVEECQGTKVPIQAFADRVTGIFVPGIILITIFTFASYLIFPEFHRAIITWGSAFLPWLKPDLPNLTLAFITATAVLVISCPCALGLGTPTALMVGSGIGAEKGILIRNGEAVQTLKDVELIAFDKTGTLTKGKPEVTDIVVNGSLSEKELLFYAASLESTSEHPLAKAFIEKAKELEIELADVERSEAIPGQGIRGDVLKKSVSLGNLRLMEGIQIDKQNHDKLLSLEEEAKTVILVEIEGKIEGLIAVADQIKEDSKAAIQQIKKMGIKTVMITGDNMRTARAIASSIGIDNVVAEVLPEGKVNAIRELQKDGKIVAMVGDGINDAPSLKQANIGLALGSGTDIAIEAADITLVNSNVMSIVTSIKLSKAIFKKIKENFFWAWFYNALAIPVAMLGLLHPMIGAAAMSMSSLNVVYNSLRLKKVKL